LILSHVSFICKPNVENTALKSVDFDEVTDKNKLAPFLWPTVYMQLPLLACGYEEETFLYS